MSCYCKKSCVLPETKFVIHLNASLLVIALSAVSVFPSAAVSYEISSLVIDTPTSHPNHPASPTRPPPHLHVAFQNPYLLTIPPSVSNSHHTKTNLPAFWERSNTRSVKKNAIVTERNMGIFGSPKHRNKTPQPKLPTSHCSLVNF